MGAESCWVCARPRVSCQPHSPASRQEAPPPRAPMPTPITRWRRRLAPACARPASTRPSRRRAPAVTSTRRSARSWPAVVPPPHGRAHTCWSRRDARSPFPGPTPPPVPNGIEPGDRRAPPFPCRDRRTCPLVALYSGARRRRGGGRRSSLATASVASMSRGTESSRRRSHRPNGSPMARSSRRPPFRTYLPVSSGLWSGHGQSSRVPPSLHRYAQGDGAARRPLLGHPRPPRRREAPLRPCRRRRRRRPGAAQGRVWRPHMASKAS